jgi:YgiT-type zinc finger domain-containing protein
VGCRAGKKEENKNTVEKKGVKELNQEERCMACGKQVVERIYAVYHSGVAGKKDEVENVSGFLCESCGRKHKMKPIKAKNPFAKLEQLKIQTKPE